MDQAISGSRSPNPSCPTSFMAGKRRAQSARTLREGKSRSENSQQGAQRITASRPARSREAGEPARIEADELEHEFDRTDRKVRRTETRIEIESPKGRSGDRPRVGHSRTSAPRSLLVGAVAVKIVERPRRARSPTPSTRKSIRRDFQVRRRINSEVFRMRVRMQIRNRLWTPSGFRMKSG